MSKVSRTIKFKVQVVQHFLCTTDGQRKTAARFGVDQSDVRQWVNLFKAHGVNGLVSFQRKLSPSEKEAVILYMREHRLSARQTAVHFNIKSINTVSTWVRRYDEHGLEGLHYQRSGRKKMPKPPVRRKPQKQTPGLTPDEREELEQLRAENAYLKKLQALICQQQTSGQKEKLR
jgi:transposase